MKPLTIDEPFRSRQLSASGNVLLAGLPASEYQRLTPDFVIRHLRPRDILQKAGQRLNAVYFLDGSVCSVGCTMQDGASIEVALVGREGLVGTEAIFGSSIAQADVVVQYGGPAHLLPLDVFEREMGRFGAFHGAMMRYLQGFLDQLARSAACHALHSAHQRCCRLLLTTRALLGQDELQLTQERIAATLGVRRPTVTLLLADLAKAGLIQTGRGRIRIVDSNALETAACECYRANCFGRT